MSTDLLAPFRSWKLVSLSRRAIGWISVFKAWYGVNICRCPFSLMLVQCTFLSSAGGVKKASIYDFKCKFFTGRSTFSCLPIVLAIVFLDVY